MRSDYYSTRLRLIKEGKWIVKKRQSPEASFWEKVDKNGPIPSHCPELGKCWVWIASTIPMGYGQLTFKGKVSRSNRVAWILSVGPIPPNTFVLHKCDNRACVNPKHLFLGTHSDNMRDMKEKGRNFLAVGERNGRRTKPEKTARGEKNHSKLSELDVRSIRSEYEAGETKTSLARRVGVSQTTVRYIIQRKKWKYVV